MPGWPRTLAKVPSTPNSFPFHPVGASRAAPVAPFLPAWTYPARAPPGRAPTIRTGLHINRKSPLEPLPLRPAHRRALLSRCAVFDFALWASENMDIYVPNCRPDRAGRGRRDGSRAEFEHSVGDQLPLEDFAGGAVSESGDGIGGCEEPVGAASEDPCFSTGDPIAGFGLTSTRWFWATVIRKIATADRPYRAKNQPTSSQVRYIERLRASLPQHRA